MGRYGSEPEGKKERFMAELKQVTDASFAADIEAQKGLVLLDFWAPWCGPCRMMEPILKELASEKPQITVAQLNVDENPTVAQRFDVMSIPTFILFKDGEVAKRLTGGMPKVKLLAEIQNA
jgi:thioredoxin 1